ncbi:MAG TPA: TraB/GumN family protein [Rhizomicrobium sp.]|jgi:hypothetical protein
MRRILLPIFIAIMTAAIAQPAFASGKPAARPIAATPATWTVHGTKGTVYLLGSIHALPKNIDWQYPALMQMLDSADTFVFEVPMDADSRAKATAYFRQNALMPAGMSLPSMFDAEMRADFRDVVMLTHADPTVIPYLRPWLAALVLEGEASGEKGFYATEGVDNKVYAMARARGGTHFRALERDEDQFRLFIKEGHVDDEVADLRLTFKDILANKGAGGGKGLLTAWEKGDARALANLVPENKAMSPEFRKLWIENRNRKWVPEIEGMLNEPHTFFITVGAAHLVGRTGVPNLLRTAGYKVEGP